jgi:glyoxylase-like metal-dependent hydrolase (beta-lactamase superfamily II)
MPLEIIQFQLGPMENNSYLAGEPTSRLAAVIDPSFGSQEMMEYASQHNWKVSSIWITHAHFDHIAGVSAVQAFLPSPIPVYVHPGDLPLWKERGGARQFGLDLEPTPEPGCLLSHGQALQLGRATIEVRHTPGHTPGHVVFYSAEDSTVFCGDLVFYHGVGRTDLPGGDHSLLLRSIREQIFTLPPNTRLLCGHGIESTVAEEVRENPFL